MQVVIVVFLLVMAVFAGSQLLELTTAAPHANDNALLSATAIMFWGLIALVSGFFGGLGVIGPLKEAKSRRSDSIRSKAIEREQASRIQKWEEARSRAAVAGPRALSNAEVDNARTLVSQGTSDAMQLAAMTLDSVGVTPADVADIFTSDVLKVLAESAPPECWPRAVACFASAEPCVELFAAHLNRSLPGLIDGEPGYCKQADSRSRSYQCHRTLLEHEFPRSLIDRIADTLLEHLAAQWPGYVGHGSPPHTVHAFGGRLITRLSPTGARILAALPSVGDTTDFGAYVFLSRLTELDDEVASLLANAQRIMLFGRLRSFPDTPGHIALAKRLATQDVVVLGPNACVGSLCDLILTNKVTMAALSESDSELSELIGNDGWPPI